MKRRGFTLVELLGIIVILGVLGTILTIVIVDVIEDSERDAALRSAEQLIRTITLDYTTNDNFTTDILNVLDFEYDGDKPDEGYIQFNENEKARLYMIYNDYCVSKTYDSELAVFEIEAGDICNWSIVE